MKKKALGKGLEAFLPEEYRILKDERFAELEIEQLKPNPAQPRSHFDPKALEELALSIRETGILQPVVVVPQENHYQIIVGERRWRAAQRAGLNKIPVLIRNMSQAQQYEASLIENLQREDLNPMEIARAFQRMTEDLAMTQQQVAEKVGKDRASVANYIRLLKLPEELQKMITQEKLSMGHARALITLEDPELQLACASQISRKGLSVRNVEKLIQKLKQQPKQKKPPLQDPDLMAVQEDLLKHLGTKVAITGRSTKGVIKIHYYSLDDLNRIYEKIKGEIL
jgi:ParB family chromosome partitioning protein